MKISIILCLLVVSSTAGCQRVDVRQKIANEYSKSLAFFDKKLINHFPDKLSDNCAYSTNVLRQENVKLLGFGVNELFFWKKYQKNEYFQLKKEFEGLSKNIYLANDNNLLLLFSYWNNDTIDGNLRDDLESPLKISLAKKNVTTATSLPIPLFDIEDYQGNSMCGLNNDFKLYLLNAKPGKYLPDKYLKNCECLPKKWEHGYSKGVALSDEKQTVIYWIDVW